jgi:type I restriction enzyme M protein
MSHNVSSELRSKLWAIAENLRGNSAMEANDFKNYVLGVIFYKFLSERVQDAANKLLAYEDTPISYEQAWQTEEYKDVLKENLIESTGYFISPQYLFSTLVTEIKKGDSGQFTIDLLQEAINFITESTQGSDAEEDFKNLFEDLKLYDSKLGPTDSARSEFMQKIMLSLEGLSFRNDDVEIDVLGDAYEYMISNFAATAGKKAGEFYTPQAVSTILAKIVTTGKTKIKNVYDPTAGSGSLLLRVARDIGYKNVSCFYGQELIPTTYNLARMNMMLHGVPYHKFRIFNGNTLTAPAFMDIAMDAVVANPPYSIKWDSSKVHSVKERFDGYSRMAPNAKADYAFVQTGLHVLSDEGKMAVVLPHGILFRGGAEAAIRKEILEKNQIDAIISLPANIFFGTGIPTVIAVFSKCRKEDEQVLFIDASQEFDKQGNQSFLLEEHVSKIVETYRARKELDKYSRNVSLEEIRKNDHNLNISRYIDTSEAEELVDLEAVKSNLSELNSKLEEVESEIEAMVAQLEPVDEQE